MTIWLEPHPRRVAAGTQSAVGGHPLVAQILAQRGFGDPTRARAFLTPDFYVPAPPFDLPDLDRAVERLLHAVATRETIGVWGDFDVDGQTATTLLVSALRSFGARVIYHIPVRAVEGHGVNLPVMEDLIRQGMSLLVTGDTGVSAHDAVAHARQQGIDVVITDHHDLPPDLPVAVAVVNPKRLPLGHPLGALPGVGVAYKVVEGMLQRSGRGDACQEYLDLVALGIVADLALLTGDTRYLLQRGLAELRRTQRLGLQVLISNTELNADHLNEEHIAFAIAPRLNALGRLDDANPAVEFLTTTDPSRARVLATQLEGLNARRQLLTNQVFQGAMAQIERDPSLLEHAALVLAHPAWEPGVIGIVASQLVERFHRPAVLIAAPPGELARGSARSVEGCNITAAIAQQADLLAGYGGHPMAAGLTLSAEHIPQFRRRLSRAVQSMMGDDQIEPRLAIDSYIDLADLSLDLVEDLERLAPFGPANPPPILATRNLRLAEHAKVGRNGEHRSLVVQDEAGVTQRVIWWDGGRWPLPTGTFDLAYTVRASTFRGQRDVQVEWKDARLVAEPVVEVAAPSIAVVDHRRASDPLALLAALREQADLQVWCEADARRDLDGQDRYHLIPGQALAIWTTPPGRSEMQAVLEQVQPKVVYLFGIDPAATNLQEFLQRLAGLVKHVLNTSQGQTMLPALAAATAQRESTVRLGLDWLVERGVITYAIVDGSQLQLATGSGVSSAQLRAIAQQLQSALDETAAFRAYFARADTQALLE